MRDTRELLVEVGDEERGATNSRDLQSNKRQDERKTDQEKQMDPHCVCRRVVLGKAKGEFVVSGKGNMRQQYDAVVCMDTVTWCTFYITTKRQRVDLSPFLVSRVTDGTRSVMTCTRIYVIYLRV